MVKIKDITTIRVRKLTRDKLASFGAKGESFDTIINRMISVVENELKTSS